MDLRRTHVINFYGRWLLYSDGVCSACDNRTRDVIATSVTIALRLTRDPISGMSSYI